MTIKHLVLPGGGAASLRLLGALQRLEESNVWQQENIKSIHAVSAGTLIAVLIALNFDMETIVDYMIGRPWDNVFQISLVNIFDVFSKKGFFGTETIVTFMKPFFNARDISLDITLSQLFELTNIQLYLYTVELSSFKLVTVSHETFPDLQVLKAIQMSAAYPVLISPVILDNKCYIDGGVICNYPINHCLSMFPDKSEVLGIGSSLDIETKEVTEETTIFEYLLEIIFKTVVNVYDRQMDFQNRIAIPNYVEIEIPSVTITNLQLAFNSIEERKKLLNEGQESADEFIQNINKEKDTENEDEDECSDETTDEMVSNSSQVFDVEEETIEREDAQYSDTWFFENMPIV